MRFFGNQGCHGNQYHSSRVPFWNMQVSTPILTVYTSCMNSIATLPRIPCSAEPISIKHNIIHVWHDQHVMDITGGPYNISQVT